MDNRVVGRGASGEAGCWAYSLLCRVPFHPRHAGATAAARPTTHHRHRHGTLRRATAGRRRVAAKGDGVTPLGWRPTDVPFSPLPPLCLGGSRRPPIVHRLGLCFGLAGEGRPPHGGGACRHSYEVDEGGEGGEMGVDLGAGVDTKGPTDRRPVAAKPSRTQHSLIQCPVGGVGGDGLHPEPFTCAGDGHGDLSARRVHGRWRPPRPVGQLRR